MSVTDTKETPTPRTDIEARDNFYAAYSDDGKTLIGVYVDEEFARTLERELTAVTAQRDRALGLLERAINLIAHAPVCLADHGSPCACDHNKLLAEYEALRKGER